MSQIIAPAPPGGRLPAFPTNFVGRQAEAAEVERLLQTARLTTLTGSPGSGKTRLALEIARLARWFPDGVWWCDLAATSDSALIPQTIASAVGVSEEPGRPLLDTIADDLARHRALLVLDNCEHQTSACARVAEVLLDGCPHLTILATSLEPLGHPWETVWRVPPLPVPEVDRSPETIGQADSVRLFVDRARRIEPSFALGPHNAATVAAICRRLDGLPLAIELAAARVRVLTVEQIGDRLDDALGLLTRSEFDRAPRHRTLRATLDWTHGLLSDGERALLRLLSVFAGSFTLEMVEAVFNPGLVTSSPAVLDLLSGLADKSLIQLLPRAGEPAARYRLPEVIRQYARSALEESGEATQARSGHLQWILELAEQTDAKWVGPERAAWLDRLEVDHDDVRAALRWARTSRQITPALRLARGAWRLWFTRGHWTEGRAWCEELLALDVELGFPSPTTLRADVLYRAGTFAYRHHDFPAASRHLEESASLCRTANLRELPSSLNVLAMIATLQGDRPRAVELYEEALAVSRAHSDRWFVGVILLNLGGCLREQGDYVRAATCFEELATFGDTADLAGHGAGQMGALAAAMGDFDLSRDRLETAVRQFEQLQDNDTLAEVFEELGRLAINHRMWDLAETWLGESLRAAQAVSSSYRILYAEIGLGHLARERREYEKARQIYAQSQERARGLGDSLGMGLASHGLGVLELDMGDPARAAEKLWEALRHLRSTGRPLETVAAMEDLASALAGQGQAQLAGRLMAAASTWRGANGAPLPPLGRPRYQEAEEHVRSSLGTEAYRRLETAAAGITWQESLDEAMRAVAAPTKTPAGRRPPDAAPPEPALHIFAFGPARVSLSGRSLGPSDWTYAKSKELLFYLLSRESASKSQIGLDLWPEASPGQLRQAFHSALHHLRRALGRSDWVRFDGDRYAFNRDRRVAYDVVAFEEHLQQAHATAQRRVETSGRDTVEAHLKAAIEISEGEYLADMTGAEWALIPREALRQRRLDAMVALADLYFESADYARAADAFNEALAMDGYLELAHRGLMRCHARQGEAGRAVRHYRRLADLLQSELAASPSPESAMLYERIRRGDDV